MKHLRITLEDTEYKELQKVKGTMSWHDLLMTTVNINKQKK